MKRLTLLALILLVFPKATSICAEEKETKSPLDEGIFLISTPITVENNALEKEDPTISIELSNFKGNEFGEISSRRHSVFKDGRVEFKGLSYPKSSDNVKPQYKRASFVIDYDEPIFKDLVKEIERKNGPKPSVEQLSTYVNEFIANKSMKRGFDIASKVAAIKEGDCSEHAVLLVALARLFGFAARTVFGLVLVEIQDKMFAFGHAWVEIHQKGEWRPADAAMIEQAQTKEKLRVFCYVPIQVQNNEGPGYVSEMFNEFSVLNIKSITVK